MPLNGPAVAPEPFIQLPDPTSNAVFSPDGRYVAYNQRQGDRDQVYVQRYPAGPRTQISVDGGWGPAWSPKGGELFYRSSSGIMAVPIAQGVRGEPPRLLFEYRGRRQADWDVGPDGSRFLVVEAGRRDRINVVQNWFEELKAKVPSAR